jgi:hypothetical protein
MPSLHQLALIIRYNALNVHDLLPTESATSGESHRFQPKLCQPILSLHVHVQRFVAVAGIEEQPVRPVMKDGRHGRIIKNCSNSGKYTSNTVHSYLTSSPNSTFQ